MEYLIPIGILALLGLMAYLLTRSNKNQLKLIEELAQKEAWEFSPKQGRFDGLFELKAQLKAEQYWTLRAYDKQSDTKTISTNVSGPYTEWSIPLLSSGTDLYMMPKDPSMKMLNDEKLLPMLRPLWNKMGLNADQWELYNSLDSDIQSAYLILTNQAKLASQIFDSAPFKTLLKRFSQGTYALRPAFRIYEGKAEIQIRKAIFKPEEIKELVDLGLAYFNACAIS